MWSEEQYEEYLFLYMEGELGEKETEELAAFWKQHPERAADIKDWEDARLIPEPDRLFPEKDSLLRKEKQKGPVIIHYRLVAAAAVLLLLAMVYYNRNPSIQQVALETEQALPVTETAAQRKVTETPVLRPPAGRSAGRSPEVSPSSRKTAAVPGISRKETPENISPMVPLRLALLPEPPTRPELQRAAFPQLEEPEEKTLSGEGGEGYTEPRGVMRLLAWGKERKKNTNIIQENIETHTHRLQDIGSFFQNMELSIVFANREIVIDFKKP